MPRHDAPFLCGILHTIRLLFFRSNLSSPCHLPRPRYNFTMPLPFRRSIVTLIKVEVFLLGGWQLWQGILYWQQFALLTQFEPVVDLRLLGIGSFFWALLFLGTAVQLTQNKLNDLRRAPYLIAIFLIYLLLIQLLFNQTAKSATQWSTTILLYLVIIGVNYWFASPVKETK